MNLENPKFLWFRFQGIIQRNMNIELFAQEVSRSSQSCQLTQVQRGKFLFNSGFHLDTAKQRRR